MIDEMARRFPEGYIYATFCVTLVTAILETGLMAYLVRDAWRHRRDPHLGLRIGVVLLLSGSWSWRLFATYSLWRYHWPDVPTERLLVEGWLMASVVCFAALWGRDARRREQ